MGQTGVKFLRIVLLTLLAQFSQVADAANAALPQLAPLPQNVFTLPAPVVTGFNPIGCYKKGAQFNILGKYFGTAQGNRSAALRGTNVFLDVVVEAWSNTRIRARIPDAPQLQPGQWYYVGITDSTGKWLSKLDHSLQICEQSPASKQQTTTASTSSAQITPPPGDGAPAYQSTGTPGRVGSGSLLGQALPPPPQITEFVPEKKNDASREPDELLVVSPDMPQAEQVRQLAQGLGLGIKRRSVLKGLGLVVSVFRVPQGTTPGQALQQMNAQAPGLWLDVNHRLTLQGTDARRYAPRMINWPKQTRACGKGLRIGLVDGPLPTRHPLLAGASIKRRSFVTRGVTPGSTDHALSIAAILAGGKGRGLIRSAKFYLAEVMRQRDDKHVDTTVDQLVRGLDWLAQQHVDLINLSLGGPRNRILEAAVQRLADLGIPLVAAAGNGGPDAKPLYPAANPGVIAVTAIDAKRRLYPAANRGDYIRFAAPGVDIWVPHSNGGAYVSGTSFAAPYVTALLALRRQQQPRATWARRLQALTDGAVDLGKPGRDPSFGYGLPRAKGGCGRP